MLSPRGIFAAVADSSGKIYAIGGIEDSDSISSVEIYDPVSDSWQASSGCITPDRLSHGVIITEDDTIFVIGGSQHHQADSLSRLLASCKSWNKST